MRRASRLALGAVSAAVLAACLGFGISGLPAIGEHRTTYAQVIEAVAVPERHAQNLVAAVTFDYRGIDTLLEEVILFAAVVGTTLLLRAAWTETPQETPIDTLEAEDVPPESRAVASMGTVGAGALFTFGAAIVAHGYLTPGGGFQGGVVLAGALFLVYLGRDFDVFRGVARAERLERTEALAILAICALGLSGLFTGGAFLENYLPLGTTGRLFSSGLIAPFNLMAGLGVFTGVGLLVAEFLEQTLVLREGKRWS